MGWKKKKEKEFSEEEKAFLLSDNLLDDKSKGLMDWNETADKLLKLKGIYLEAKEQSIKGEIHIGLSVMKEIETGGKYNAFTEKDKWLDAVVEDLQAESELGKLVRKYKVTTEYAASIIDIVKQKVLDILSDYNNRCLVSKNKYKETLRQYVELAFEAKKVFSEKLDWLKVPYY